ncbi:hypothetical protein [Massilia sp. S19_KUP03_FR1]|uniref:hypothetical protein n=1 Tax=Massilia sp. S19_KUP03_FR1 TaxID=3025503 RepID=UPI003FA58C63
MTSCIDRLSKRGDDTDVTRLLLAYLNPGIVNRGVVMARAQGTPQGGCFSPLLANMLLDEPEQPCHRHSGGATMTWHRHALANLHSAWTHSRFVRIGNPHYVTLSTNVADLPSFMQLHECNFLAPFTRIAFAGSPGEGSGDPCRAGVNLQWAVVIGEQRVLARIFERGEGTTAYSGKSASAVACAAWMAGLVTTGIVNVEMPGGTAPVRLWERRWIASMAIRYSSIFNEQLIAMP